MTIHEIIAAHDHLRAERVRAWHECKPPRLTTEWERAITAVWSDLDAIETQRNAALAGRMREIEEIACG